MEYLATILDFVTKFVITGAFLTFLGIVWKASGRFARLETTVERLVDNDLPHLTRAVEKLSERFDSFLLRDKET